MRIQTKFVTILTLFSILPSAFIGLVAFSIAKAAIMNNIASHSSEFIYLVGGRINNELFHNYESVLTWSEDEEMLLPFMNKGVSLKTFKSLEGIVDRHESLAYLALLGAEGRVVESSDRGILPPGEEFRWYSGFQKALLGNSFMEDVKYDDFARERTLLLFTPVRDKADFSVIKGVLVASFRWDYFASIIRSVNIRKREQGDANHIMLTQKDGVVISGADHDSEVGDDLASLGLKSVQFAAEGKDGYVVELSEHNNMAMMSYAPLPDYQKMPNPGWLILLHQDYEELISPVRKIQKVVVSSSAILALVLMFISVRVGKRITTPILSIASAATRFGKGDFQRALEVSSHDEIQVLASSFNSMVEELERSKEQLFQSHEYLSGIFSSMNDCIVVLSDHKIKEVNWATLTSLGYLEEELLGEDMGVLFSDNYNPILEEERKGGDMQFYDKEALYKTKSGEMFPVILSCSKLYLSGFDPFSVLDESSQTEEAGSHDLILIAKDITARKEMEEELRESKKSAVDANRAKTVFLSNMSHEIRTPMNAIIGMTSLVLDIERDREKVEYLNIIRMSAESLLSLLNDLLDMSKIESGKLELQSIDFDLRQVIHDSIKSISFNVHSKQVELIVNISPLIHTVINGDPLRLRQVIINLVGNAIKFTSSGEVELKIESALPGSASESNGICNYLFSVRDTGKGIPDEKLGKIFDSFYQVDDSGSRKYEGTGLGLSISRQIVELMGGRIWAKSELGKGTTLFFNAKFRKLSDSVEQLKKSTSEALKDKKILIVDDNRTNRLLLKHTLESNGCRTVEAVDGNDAVERFKEAGASRTPIDLVLMDYYMPGINGVEAARLIQARFDAENIRFIILSSAEGRVNASLNDGSGLLETLLKPVNQAELLYKISSAIQHTSRRKMVEKVPPAPPSKRHTILLVEDKRVNQILAVKLLEKQGYRVEVAQNGLEAIEALKERPFDLMLTDIQMPEMDGLEATRVIRASDPSTLPAAIPIVAMSACTLDEDRETCLKAGMNDHVPKPVDRENLFSVLDKWLPKEPSSSALSTLNDQWNMKK